MPLIPKPCARCEAMVTVRWTAPHTGYLAGTLCAQCVHDLTGVTVRGLAEINAARKKEARP
jgi:hypothetical protein